MSWQAFGTYLYENPEIIAGLMAGIPAGVGLYFTARTFRHQQQQAQVKMIESVFKDIRELEKEVAAVPGPTDEQDQKYKKAMRDWDSRFFNTLEWFSFLINAKQVENKKLIDYFKPSIIAWYEKMFIKHYDASVINDPKRFEEFKKLYNRLKADREPSFFRMKHES